MEYVKSLEEFVNNLDMERIVIEVVKLGMFEEEKENVKKEVRKVIYENVYKIFLIEVC